MPPTAHTALVVSIVASALGALFMCVLVARYGLTTSGGEYTGRGLIITRFGHAFAGVCFAATGILGIVALAAPTRESPPATAVQLEPDRAAEARLHAVAAEVKALTTRIEQAEARMTVVDGTARRLGDEVGSINARARELERATATRASELERTFAARTTELERSFAARTKELERTLAALPRRAVEPAAKDAKPAPVSPRNADRATPPGSDPLSPALPTAPAPQMPEPATAPPRGPEPMAYRPPPSATRAAEPAPGSRVASSPSSRPTAEAPARPGDRGAAVPKSDDAELTDKLREDWKTIRGGLTTAGDDFKAAVKDLGRKLWR